MECAERPLYPFEVYIAARFKTLGKAWASYKGEWIRGYLLTFGEGSPYAMWKEYRCFAERILGTRAGTYADFARYMWILKKLGLVYVARRVPGPRGIPRAFYRIVPGMENSDAWLRPVQTLYPSTDWTIMPEEKKEKYR